MEINNQEFFDDAYWLGSKALAEKWQMSIEDCEKLHQGMQEQGYQRKRIDQPQQQQQQIQVPGMIQNIVPHIVQTLQQDENARRELYAYIKRESGIDPAPYIDNFLKTKTQARYLSTMDMKEPAADLAKTVIQMWDEDGFDMWQIAQQTHLKLSVVREFITNKDHWLRMAQKKVASMALVEAGIIEPGKALPWYIRYAMKVRGWFGK